jgi:hypothetical protein
LTEVARLLQAEGIEINGSPTLTQVKTAEALARIEQKTFELAVTKQQYVELRHVQAHIGRAFTGIRRTFQNMPARYSAAMAAKLGIDQIALCNELDRMVFETLHELSEPPRIPQPDGKPAAASAEVVEEIEGE